MRLGRLELPRPKALEPKSSASANSATGARRKSMIVPYSPPVGMDHLLATYRRNELSQLIWTVHTLTGLPQIS